MMNVQTILDTATSVNAASFGAGEAAKIFRESLKNSYKVRVNLKTAEKSWLQRSCRFPLVFTGEQTVTNDHSLLVSLRNLARDIYESEFKVSHTALRTLVVGASCREIKMYQSNPHIHYFVHGKENKDWARVVRPALESIADALKRKVSKTDYRVYLTPGAQDPVNPRGVLKRYVDIKHVLHDYMVLQNMPANIHTQPCEADVLLLEDTVYGLGEDGITSLFQSTGAKIAYGYAMVPVDLVFDNVPENRVYKYTKHAGGYASMTFVGGHANGYHHKAADWGAILRKLVMKGHGVTVAVEITARVGPMCVFKLYRCDHKETIVRTLELEEHEEFVQLLDVYACVNIKTGRASSPLTYFSVRETEYWDVLVYLLSLDPKSLSLQNCLTYVRRRMGGMSLVTKELLAPWDLPKRLVYKFAITVTLQAMLLHEKTELIRSNLGVGSVMEKFHHSISAIGHTIVSSLVPRVLTELIAWLFSEHLVDQLVLFPFQSKLDLGKVREAVAAKLANTPPEGDLAPAFPNEEDTPDCPICAQVHGRLGEQKLKCEHLEPSIVSFSLTDAQVAALHTSFIDNDLDPSGLKSVKDRAAKSMPTTGFKIDVKVRYIRGGPGCGKSHLIRVMADENDLVVAPFTKLKPDYEGLINQQGDGYDLIFKTTHRAMEVRGHKRVFLDEFTSFPYEILACILYNNGAEELFLVGDELQTKVQEPTEGLYIGNYVPLNEVSKHTLLVNFRNPPATVAMLNRLFGYEMRASKTTANKIRVHGPDDPVPQNVVAHRIGFSHVSAELNTGDKRNTVRANQGGSHDNVVLYVNSSDKNVLGATELQIVALSRHKEELYLVHDGGPEALTFVESLGCNEDFYDHIQTWLTFVDETTRQIVLRDESVEAVLKPHQPPSDAYLISEMVLQPTASVEEVTALNEAASQVVVDNFRTGVLAEDFLTPRNMRGHPKGLAEVYYSMGPGNGLHYSSKKPMQVLQVTAARYFNYKPTYRCTYTEQMFALDLVHLYIRENHRENWECFDNNKLEHEVRRFIKTCSERHYAEQFQGLDNPDGRVVRFELKGIFKPKIGDFDPYKAGQGISAWSKDALAMYCLVWRIIGNHAISCENPNVLTDHGISEADFIRDVQEAYRSVPSVALNGTTDGEMFDSQQNEFTQMLEYLYYKELGVDETLLEHYYSFRKNYVIQGQGVRGVAASEKTSGEPDTLGKNGVVAKVQSNAVIRGEGPSVTVYKGDDYSKRQCNLQVNKEMQSRLESVCPLRLKITISQNTEFCGLMLADGAIFPGVIRRLNKLSGHRFRDYTHFAEYQKSLRNFVKLVEDLGYAEVMAGNALAGGCEVGLVEGAMEALTSFAHINEEQFREKFKVRTEPDSIPFLIADTLYVSAM